MRHSKTCATGHQLLGGWGRGGRGGRGRGVQGGGDTQSAGRRRRCRVTLARGEGVGVGLGVAADLFRKGKERIQGCHGASAGLRLRLGVVGRRGGPLTTKCPRITGRLASQQHATVRVAREGHRPKMIWIVLVRRKLRARANGHADKDVAIGRPM